MDPMGYGTPNIQYHSILSRHLQKSLYVPRRFSEDPARKTARNHFMVMVQKPPGFWVHAMDAGSVQQYYLSYFLPPRSSTKHHWRLDGTLQSGKGTLELRMI